MWKRVNWFGVVIGIQYLGASALALYRGQYWLGATFFLYALSSVTLGMVK